MKSSDVAILTLALLSWADMYPTHMLSVVWLHRNSTVNKRETNEILYLYHLYAHIWKKQYSKNLFETSKGSRGELAFWVCLQLEVKIEQLINTTDKDWYWKVHFISVSNVFFHVVSAIIITMPLFSEARPHFETCLFCYLWMQGAAMFIPECLNKDAWKNSQHL